MRLPESSVDMSDKLVTLTRVVGWIEEWDEVAGEAGLVDIREVINYCALKLPGKGDPPPES